MNRVTRWSLLGAVLGPGVVLSAQPRILAGPIAYNGHRYYVLDVSTWTAAEAAAVALGGHLATINDAAENNWVHRTLGGFIGPNDTLWIGLNDAAVEGVFVWSSGERVTYLNWEPGEPNNSGNEDFVQMYMSFGRWNDYANRAFPFGAVEVDGCYPDCDTSTGPGSLDIFDFLCFNNRYEQRDPYACDCDTSTGPGDCNVFDFLCFQNAYGAGCP